MKNNIGIEFPSWEISIHWPHGNARDRMAYFASGPKPQLYLYTMGIYSECHNYLSKINPKSTSFIPRKPSSIALDQYAPGGIKMNAPLVVEQFCSGPPGKALLEAAMAVFLPKEGYWITGAKGHYAWSTGCIGGMKDYAHPVNGSMEGAMVAQMHQDCIAYAMNNDAGFAAVTIGPGKFRICKVGLLGYDRWLTVYWNGEQFDVLAPLRREFRDG